MVALFNVDGRFHAVSNRCPHRGGPLGQGFVDGAEVSCPWHNWTFDVTTGGQHDQQRHDRAVPRGEGRGRAGLRPNPGPARRRGMTSPRLVLALLAAAGLASAQEPVRPLPADQVAPPTFAAEVEQVVVDLVVVDKEGDPVPGITRDDLVITEDGVEQSVVSFEAVVLPDEPADEAAPAPAGQRQHRGRRWTGGGPSSSSSTT